jgi:flagellar biosynthetic protein FlhB
MYIGLSPFVSGPIDAWASLFVIDSRANLDMLGLAKVRSAFGMLIMATIIVGVPLAIVVIITQAAVGGVNFSSQAMYFKPNRIDPLAGLKRMFSVKGLVELGKAVLKVTLLFSIGGLIIYSQLPKLVYLSAGSLAQGIGRASATFPILVGGLLVALFVIAVIDFAWQKHTHMQSLRMTIKEVKDDSKQSEGSPEVKAKIRRMQYQQSQDSARQREALDNVPNATAIITNPTHFAVALQYTNGQAGAPTVLAMGKGVLAQQIIERGADANVRTLRIPMLARALYFTSEIGGEISEALYNAIAIVLAYVFRVNNGETLEMPELTLPPEVRFDEFGKLESEA